LVQEDMNKGEVVYSEGDGWVVNAKTADQFRSFVAFRGAGDNCTLAARPMWLWERERLFGREGEWKRQADQLSLPSARHPPLF